jgi:hypothetical protein
MVVAKVVLFYGKIPVCPNGLNRKTGIENE